MQEAIVRKEKEMGLKLNKEFTETIRIEKQLEGNIIEVGECGYRKVDQFK